jgi:UDP-N-acetylmuramate dehydrogenase
MSAEFIREIRERIRGEILEDEPMAPRTSYRIGGPADVWAEPDSIEDLIELIKLCGKHGAPYKILGRGSNVLIRDGGIRGVVISLKKACARLDSNPPDITAGAAVSMSALANDAAKRGLTGLEFCAGIPGSVGGGLATNAGAWGRSILQKLKSVLVYDTEAGKVETVAGERIDHGYRRGALASSGVILEAEFTLECDEPQNVKDRMRQYGLRRGDSQPQGRGNAGCVFKNPPGGYAGALIDALGFKGYMSGDAMVSDVHANFIVNTGAASAADVLALISEIKARALESSGIELEEEIEVVGED